MLSPTLTEGLERYEIGPKLRTLRLKRKMGLVQLGQHTGLSPALLSKVERGKLFPTLPTLLRISLVFGVGLDHFFSRAGNKPVPTIVRRAERLRVPEGIDAMPGAVTIERLDGHAAERTMNAYFVEFDAAPATSSRPREDPHDHAGGEMLYLLRGQLVVTYDDEEYLLTEGDSMYFDATRPHRYTRQGSHPCAAIIVTT